MNIVQPRCVLLADAHHGLSEGVRRLLATAFEAIVMVADEVSLFEAAARLRSDLAVVDLRVWHEETNSTWCAGSGAVFRTPGSLSSVFTTS